MTSSNLTMDVIFLIQTVSGEGVSTGSICPLSVFQAITISPRNSRWAELKVKAPKYIVPSIFLCWMLQMLSTKTSQAERILDTVLLFIMTKPDRQCMEHCYYSLMFLFGAHALGQWLRGLHPVQVPRLESRAAKTILLLVSTVVYFYTLSSIFQLLLSLFDHPSWFLVDMTVITAACFPSVSPFLLMSCDSSVHRLYFAWLRNTKSLTIMRNM
ncbi:hypothetical protein E2I00_011054 [Balaenoptera physalus]|uniref:Vomeronasal type-1 receptor n=1 Tax=Balaenoptera physalus TaxID=9770 RepID=A0A643BMT8_BALPH|nr:hypothetical protein E2I00_011054 [Balaenoptera physalus]